MHNIESWSLTQASQHLTQKSVSSRELTQFCLDRIGRHDDKIRSFITVDDKAALTTANQSDQRRANNQVWGPLDGIPIALKDMILTQGLQTTAGSKMLEGYIPPYDATVTRKLKDAGSVMIGKLNQDEFAMGSSNETSAYGICRNPWDLSRTPGGSSGGSAAAVAASFCFGSLGTDTGGSIRLPASFCGVAGIKPSYGRVSRYGVVAFASSLDQVGPMAHDVGSASLMLQTIAGYDDRDPTSVDRPVPDYSALLGGDIKGLRVGIAQEYFSEGLAPEVRAAVQTALDALKSRGATVVDVSLPTTEYGVATYYIIAAAEASSNLSRYDGIRYGPRRGDGHSLIELYEKTRGELFGSEVKRRIMLGAYVLSSGYYDAYYLRAQKVRTLLAQDFSRAFEKVDVLLSPTSPTVAFGVGARTQDPLTMYLSDIYTICVNLAGLPAISINCGYSSDGMPIGAQLIAKPFDESTMLNAAFAIEESLDKRQLPRGLT